MEFRTRFNHADPVVDFVLPSVTEQSHAKECDINCIMARYRKTGVLAPDHQLRSGYYADLCEIGSYEEMQQAIVDAESHFMKLSPDQRDAFGNNVYRFLDEIHDSSKIDKFIKLGLVAAKPSTIGTQANPADVTDLKGGSATSGEVANVTA